MAQELDTNKYLGIIYIYVTKNTFAVDKNIKIQSAFWRLWNLFGLVQSSRVWHSCTKV